MEYESDLPRDAQPDRQLSPRTRRYLIYIALGLAALLIWFAGRVLLLLFASVLFALFLRGLTRWLAHYTSLSKGWSLAVVITVLLTLAVLTGWLVVPRIADQIPRLNRELSQALDYAQNQITQSQLWRDWLDSPNLKQILGQMSGTLSKVSFLFSTGTGIIVDLIVVLFIGFYLAVDPEPYRRGLLKLLPPAKRSRPREISDVVATTLQRWLVGRLFLMALGAVVISLVLWWMDIPLAIFLGIMSGLLSFIPNVGPVIAAIPVLLLAFMKAPIYVLYVLIFYVFYQILDGFVLTPLIQRQTVFLPPALTLTSQVLLGVIAGPVGVILAVPVMATIMVVIKMAYLEDMLGEDVSLPGQQ